MAKTPIEIAFGAATDLEELVQLAIGAASMCWEKPEGAGIFDDRTAREISQTLVHRIEELTGPACPDFEDHMEKIIDGSNGNVLRVVRRGVGHHPATVVSGTAKAGSVQVTPNAAGEFSATLPALPGTTEQEFLGNDPGPAVPVETPVVPKRERPAESWFEQDLENAINWASIDARAGEPDWLLAQTLVKAPSLQPYVRPAEPASPEPQLGDVTDLDDSGIGEGFGESIRRGIIEAGITELVQQSGTNSRDHGFHQDRERIIDIADHQLGDSAVKEELLRLWQISKLDLMHEELSEVLGELRDGRDFNEIYYLDKKSGVRYFNQAYEDDGTPKFKPEGAIIELADLIIRAADLAFTEGSDLAQAIAIKHEYNASRPYLHGRKL